MSEQLITVGEATEILGVTSDLPANKCLTKAEFDELTGRLQPESAPNGVYIMHKDRFLVKKERWAFPNEDASGVAVKTDKCSVVIAKEEQSSIQWGGYGTLVDGCFTSGGNIMIGQDYAGKDNTDAIVNTLGKSVQYAALYCQNYTFIHGVKGHLPAYGELYQSIQNKTEVDACMSLIGGKALGDNDVKWCSTQRSEGAAWSYGWSSGTTRGYDKNTSHTARPFSSF